MSQPNVGSMPQDYWSWLDDDTLKPLGICEGYAEACDKAPGNSHWILSRDSLTALRDAATKELEA